MKQPSLPGGPETMREAPGNPFNSRMGSVPKFRRIDSLGAAITSKSHFYTSRAFAAYYHREGTHLIGFSYDTTIL